MRCPKDGRELETRQVHESDVEFCSACGGMYLSHGHLNRVAEPTSGDIEFSTVDLDSFDHEDVDPPVACPRDEGVTMKKVEFLIETNLILDYCSQCQGFWLDGRELTRINDEIRKLNEAEREISDPISVRLAKFFWSLPVPH